MSHAIYLLIFFMMSINNVGGCCFIFHRLVNKDYDWDSLVQFVMHYSFIIMQELLLPIRQQPSEFMNIRNYVRNAVSDITRNWLSKMEISNVFPLISNFVFELSLFVVVDGAVKFLQNTRLLWINFGYLFRGRYCTNFKKAMYMTRVPVPVLIVCFIWVMTYQLIWPME